MTDPADCGPVTLAFCQDVQAEAYDYPESFFEPKVWRIRRPSPTREVADVVAAIGKAKGPLIVAGGGVLYSGAEKDLLAFARKRNIPLVESQAGKGAVDWQEDLNFGSPGVTGSDVANQVCTEADLIIGVGTRFQDFTTGSWTVFANPARKLVSINLAGYDVPNTGQFPSWATRRWPSPGSTRALGDRRFPDQDKGRRKAWFEASDAAMAAPNTEGPPTDAQVIGAVQRQA